ncbi:MAG: GNAT family N-acetyltransferase [Alphaproteobacteria bacterium]|nr:MAG: GNAT family N-acetyltransferase [Alphaproteobacteria bacterium]
MDRDDASAAGSGARERLTVRPAIAADLPAVGAIQVESWRETYAGILDPAGLARLTPARSAHQWDANLARGDTMLFVAQRGAKLLGFGSCGTQRSRTLRELGYGGEISTIYLPRAAQGLGLGRVLMQEMAAALAAWGYGSLALWVLVRNRQARGFYAHLGGRVIARGMDRWAGKPVEECAYGWQDISLLAGGADDASQREG